MEYLIEKAASFEQTVDAHSVRGNRVLAKSGTVVGRVKEVRLDSSRKKLEGVVVGRGLFRSSLYVSRDYLGRVTEQAVMLTVNPAVLQRKRPVVSSDGKRFGTVVDVHRDKDTNTVVSYVVRRRLFWKFTIPADEVKSVGGSIVLKKSYDQAKSSFSS